MKLPGASAYLALPIGEEGTPTPNSRRDYLGPQDCLTDVFVCVCFLGWNSFPGVWQAEPD